MKLKITALVMGAVVLALGVYKFSVFTHAEPSCCGSKTSVPSVSMKTPEPTKLPEYVPYMFLFTHLANIKNTPSSLEEFQKKSKLPNGQFNKLVQIPSDYQQDVEQTDKQAQVIIDDFHRQYPPGKLPDGVAPPAAAARTARFAGKEKSDGINL